MPVILSEAKDLARRTERSFVALRMTAQNNENGLRCAAQARKRVKPCSSVTDEAHGVIEGIPSIAMG